MNYVSIGDPPPIKEWKRPLLLVAGLSLAVCTVLALRFAWERQGAVFFATVTSIFLGLALLGIAISLAGCNSCVARFLGKSL